MLANDEQMIDNSLPLSSMVKYLHYAPHAQHEDHYFKDHRHHLSEREQMRALELDPHHFYKVGQEPVHHEHRYFSDHDISDHGYAAGADFEDIFGYAKRRDFRSEGDDYDLGFSSVTASSEESNDIQFSINEDVQFKLSTSDNYQGRDVDVGIVMPGLQGRAAPMPAQRKRKARPAPVQTPAAEKSLMAGY